MIHKFWIWILHVAQIFLTCSCSISTLTPENKKSLEIVFWQEIYHCSKIQRNLSFFRWIANGISESTVLLYAYYEINKDFCAIPSQTFTSSVPHHSVTQMQSNWIHSSASHTSALHFEGSEQDATKCSGSFISPIFRSKVIARVKI